ncbi:ATP-grasp fold amidoligase family protein [Algibacter sp. L1A34]|uniref:ATP-grasp fold amidoligase family protein n=1 Tax=Algibacter sp. L1A34 TaxID=2686365 RepID=UPI001E6563F6|nr:ATP-grasp fold amidoligase family protein [Algibacter sp. L1A34]
MIKKIRKFYLRTLRKMRFLPPKLYAKSHYEYFTGKKLNLENPIEFNEKIAWYKVFYRPTILTQLVDKYAVRDYVEEKIGKQYLNELYAVYDSPEEIKYNELPQQFVLKATHASGYNLIVKNKNKLDKALSNKLLKKWLNINQYYRTGQEWAYKDVKPRIIAEKFIKDEKRESLTDYKFYCFDGIVKFMEVHIDREENLKLASYDLEFNKLPFNKMPLKNRIEGPIEKPATLNKMIELSEKLAKNIPFVRVDFYSIHDKIIFGELTFYPSDARRDYDPEEYNKIIGDYFKLPQLKNGQKVITEFN